MSLQPVFDKRDFTQTNSQPAVKWSVDSMEWDINGGPRMANLTPAGDDNALWALSSMLRCPVTIYDDKGRAPWFGYVSEVHIAPAGGMMGVGFSLETMANRVACTYTLLDLGGTAYGGRQTTEFSTYEFGTATYGQKDYIVAADTMTGANGTLTRNGYLARHQIPQGVAEIGAAQNSIVCRGWWDTMNWRLATFAGSTSVGITANLAAFVPSYGQFLTEAVLETTNTGTINPYKPGDTTAYDECAKLMNYGGANGRRIQVRVDKDRRAIFSEEPASPTVGAAISRSDILANTAAYEMDKYGNFYDPGGVRLEPHMAWQAVGRYVKLRDVTSAFDTTLLFDPSIQFLEGISWRNGVLTPEFRGDVNASGIVKPMDSGGMIDLKRMWNQGLATMARGT